MNTLYDINLFIHVVAGVVSLLTVAIPLVAAKGGRTHRRTGWVFTIAMGVVAATGVFMAAFWVAVPLMVKPAAPDAPAAVLAAHASSVRLTAAFFLLLSLITGHATWAGLSVLRPNQRPFTKAVFVIGILVTGAAVLVIGLLRGQAVFVFFGIFAVVGAVRELRAVGEAPVGPARVIAHVRSILGGATAAFTAFAVQVGSRLTDLHDRHCTYVDRSCFDRVASYHGLCPAPSGSPVRA